MIPTKVKEGVKKKVSGAKPPDVKLVDEMLRQPLKISGDGPDGDDDENFDEFGTGPTPPAGDPGDDEDWMKKWQEEKRKKKGDELGDIR